MTPFNLGSRHGRHLDVNLDRDLPLYTFEPDESTVGLVMYGPDTLHGSNCHGDLRSVWTEWLFIHLAFTNEHPDIVSSCAHIKNLGSSLLPHHR